MIYIVTNQPPADESARIHLAARASGCMLNPTPFVPYSPNDDTYEFILDAANDWRMIFSHNTEKLIFRIFHRYNNEEAVTSLSRWLMYRWHMGELVVDNKWSDLDFNK